MGRSRDQSTCFGGWIPEALVTAIALGAVLWSSRAPTPPITERPYRLVQVDDSQPEPPPPPEAVDPELELLKYWLELLRLLLHDPAQQSQQSAAELITKVAEIYDMRGLPDDLLGSKQWLAWYLDAGEVLLYAAADQLEPRSFDELLAMIDEMRLQVGEVP